MGKHVGVSEFKSCVMMLDGDVVWFQEGFGWHCEGEGEGKSDEEKKKLRQEIRERLEQYLKLLGTE